MHYMFQVLHQMGNWFLEEYSIYFKIWLMSEKNETDVWYSKYQWNWQEPEMLRNWWKMTSPQNWVELNPMSLPSTMVDTFMAFESIWRIGHIKNIRNFQYIDRPPPFTHGVQSTRIWRRLLIFTRFWKFSNFFEGICRKFFIFDVKSKTAILHQVEFRNVEKNHQKMSKLSNLQGFQNWFRLVQICFFKGFWIG